MIEILIPVLYNYRRFKWKRLVHRIIFRIIERWEKEKESDY